MAGEGRLRRPRLGKSNLRASASERSEALRRLTAYHEQGYLAAHEVAEREALVSNALTPRELTKVFADLPPLGPSQLVERRVGKSERTRAMNHLDRALDEQQIDVVEYHTAQSLVQNARSDRELAAAFDGLEDPTKRTVILRSDTARASTKVSNIAKESGRRVVKSLIRFGLSFCLFLAAIIFAIAGFGTVALIVSLLSVGALGTALLALVRVSK